MSAISASQQPEIDERRVTLNFKIGRVGEVLDHAAYYLCGRITDRLTSQIFDHTRKASEHIGRFTLFPDHIDPTPEMSDPAIFWRNAEAAERQANGQASRRILFGIPRGLPHDKYQEYLTYCLAPLIDDGMAAHIDLHDPGARDGGEQPHAHIMLTMRRLNGDGTFARKKERAWNAMFTAGRGKIMRAQFEARGNQWLAENGYNIRLRIRSNEELDGPDALPPEPTISRADIEQTKRHPEAPSPAIISLDEHRALHKRARESRKAVDGLSAEIVRLEAMIAAEDRQRLHHSEGAHDMAAKRNKSGWQAGTGGYEALSPGHQNAARIAYNKWREKHGGRPGDTVFSLPEYVDFVQARRREDKGWRFERPDADANAMHRSDPPTEIIDTDAPAPEAPRQADHAEDDMPEEDGWDRETRFRARLLAGHYKISESSLTPEQVAAISNIRLDRRRGVATIELHTGDVFEDYGDRIVSPRDPSPETAAELARAAQFHGWSHVALTGTPAYRDEVGIALALLEPPVSHDWKLSREAQERLETALAARVAAFENTNAIRPVEAPANEMQAEPAPVAEVVEPTYAVIYDADAIARGLSLEAAKARAAAEGLTDADVMADALYDAEIARRDAQHEAEMRAEELEPPPTVRVAAVVLGTGEAVSIEWLQANRDAFAGMSDVEIMAQFPSFIGEQVNPAAYQDDPSGGEDLDHATQEAEAVWDRQVGEAVDAWEAATGRVLADVPDVAPRQVFITNPRDPSGDYDAAEMRERPELSAIRHKMDKMTNEALEKRLSEHWPHYHPDVGAPDARNHAIAVWKAARAARKEAKNAYENQSRLDVLTPGSDGPVGSAPGVTAPAGDGPHAASGMADVRQVGAADVIHPDHRTGGADALRPAADGQPTQMTRAERIAQARREVVAQQVAEFKERERREAMEDRPDFDGPDF